MSEPNRLLLGLLNLAENCYGKQHLPYSDKHTLTSVGAVFRINPKAKVDADRLRQALTAIAGVSQAKLSVDATRQLESQLAIDMPDDSLEMLYCQRVERPGDIHKGEICFPGGHVDKGESDMQAAAREIKEEVNLDVMDLSRFLCLGNLNEGIHAYYKRNKRVIISLYIFVQTSLEDIPLQLSHDELSNAAWVSLSEFWTYDMQRLNSIKVPWQFGKLMMISYPSLSNLLKNNKHEPEMTIPTFDLQPFNRTLWGLTSMMTSTILEAFVFAGNKDHFSFSQKIHAAHYIRNMRTYRFESDSYELQEILNFYIEKKTMTNSLGIFRQKL